MQDKKSYKSVICVICVRCIVYRSNSRYSINSIRKIISFMYYVSILCILVELCIRATRSIVTSAYFSHAAVSKCRKQVKDSVGRLEVSENLELVFTLTRYKRRVGGRIHKYRINSSF